MLHVTDQGQGNPVVFIHGFCEMHAMWDDFIVPFTNTYRVITLDLPGFGLSPALADGFSIEDVAQEVLKTLDALKLKNPVIVAHSLGGYVTLAMTKLRPEAFAGIVLFHSTAFADSEEKKASRLKAIDFIERKGVDVFVESFIPQLFAAKKRAKLSAEIDRAIKQAATSPLASLVGYSLAMRERPDRTDVLRSFENPFLIIAGVKDTAVPIEHVYEQELMPKRGMVHILKDTGHMGMFEEKEKTTEWVADFLKLCF